MAASRIARSMTALVILASLLLTAGLLAAQEEDLNIRYAFPLSIGAEYQMLTPFGTYAGGFNTVEVALSVRVPIPGAPTFQPLVRGGVMMFNGVDPATEAWTHTHYYGGLGLAWANRIDKTFELAVDLTGGVSEAVFLDLVPETGAVGNLNAFVELGGRISLDPSYNFTIDIHPSLKWMQSLGVLQDFNGLIFGIGFGVNYRFGLDPDAPTTIINSIDFVEIDFPDAFAAMQSYYASNPIGTVVIENTDTVAIRDLEVSFFQNNYMDAPTPAAKIEELAPGESVSVSLLASYNANVFKQQGTTPLLGEIIASYSARGRTSEQKSSVSYDLRDKTNMTWTEDEKVAAFITYEDSALRNYASWVRQSCKDETVAALSGPFQTAVQIYEALGVLGCLYQLDPTKLDFEEAQQNVQVIDSVSLPRDTLTRSTGDCDDLTVLYTALLESVGVQTGFITVPGHIYAVFNTGMPVREYRQLHPDRNMTIEIDGELWVPVEITLIGSEGFMSAWRRGVDEWRAAASNPATQNIYRTAVAQTTYAPIGLTYEDLGLQYGSAESIAEAFRVELNKLTELVVADFRERAEETGKKQDFNRLGISYARLERYVPAAEAFERALRIDPQYRSAKVNLANIRFLDGDYNAALDAYTDVVEDLEAAGAADTPLAAQVLLNISRAQYELEEFDEARSTFAQAEEINSEVVSEFAYIGTATEGAGRAAEARGPEILFVGEGD